MTNPAAEPAHSAFRVLAALAELGEATAAGIATASGLGYSTVTPKLRAWEDTGQAERFRNDDNQTLWRLTDTGRAATTSNTRTAAASPPPDEGRPADPPAGPGTGSEPTDPSTHAPQRDLDPAAAPPGDDSAGAVPPPAAAEPTGQPSPGTGPKGAAASAGDTPPHAGAGSPRRASGLLRDAILNVLDAHPGQGLKVAELCRLIDTASEDTSAKKASAGAVSNAAHKLVATGSALLIAEKPATFSAIHADAT
ncbi:MarR family transcriptional regulator [Actinoplanes sp. M2I2]|uniref:MarR family transcriptional regulator n=1 Tax=Actinoplanes sp. M2I2 TaxID=1734444 RepID=UPI002021D9DA|nr:MarR family transcriptional regulator [Actinoplanes sp. M2I2]